MKHTRNSLIAIALGLAPQVMQAGENYPANHCEIFVDRVDVNGWGSHGDHGYVFKIKILPERLDGDVTEVGVRSKAEGHSSGRPVRRDWGNSPLELIGGNDYYKHYIHGNNSFSDIETQFIFYVTTSKGTTYWLNAPEWDSYLTEGDNYVIRATNIVTAVRTQCRAEGNSDCFTPSASTRGHGNPLAALNPLGCK